MMSQVLRVLRVLLAEWRMHFDDWPLLVPIIQGVLNHAPSSRLGGRAPVEVFTGLPVRRPLNTLQHPETKEVLSLKEVDERLKSEIRLLALRRNEIHKTTSRNANRLRAQRRNLLNKKS
jgi:hypothetical protein